MMLFCLPGIPFVLYGDEIEMKTMHIPSKDGGYQRTGTRLPMVWNNKEPNHGFTSGEDPYLPFNPDNTISVKQAIKDEDSLYHFISQLISLRKKIKDLSDPHVYIEEKNRVFTFGRGNHLLIVNMSKKDHVFEGKIIFSTGVQENILPPGCAVLVKNKPIHIK